MSFFRSNHDTFAALVARLWPVGVLLVSAGSVQAGPVPANLGAGLGEIAASQVAARNPAGTLARQRSLAGAVSDLLTVDTAPILRDASGRVLVDIVVDGQASYDTVRAAVVAIPGFRLASEDRKYRAGILEGFVPEASVIPLAKVPGVVAVHAVQKPSTSVGAVTQQGLVQHRVDKLPANIDGTGITVGIISDSYDTATTFVATGAPLTIHEADDIRSGDLPGPGNPLGNNQPVVVLEDFPGGTDEGRAMAQLVHDMAPKARLGFATADSGEVGFANNIRALAGVQGLPNSRADFAAQIIVDDIQYFDEGMFSDTVVAQAVDDVTALGVSYFSSAGNTAPTQGYASDFRLVPAGANATSGTNIDLSRVPPALYAGGFHNFRGDGGQDIAQTLTLGSVAGRQLRIVMQWDDPYDVTPTALGPLVAQSTGTLSAATPRVDSTFGATAGKQYQVDVRGDSATGAPGNGNLDVIVTVVQPDGTVLSQIDTGTSENFGFFATQSGTYTLRVTGFEGDTGTFTEKVNEGTGTLRVTSDFNLLFFNTTTGAYLGCACENNLSTNRPIELPGNLTFPSSVTNGQVQLVISRANTPTAPVPASRLRYKTLASSNGTTGAPAEYVSYSTPVTYGHNSAAGANGVAAYSPFRPNIPEDFTSTGPVRIVWDRNNARIPEDRQVRLKPEMAAMDGGNTTFFTSDTGRDLDTLPNFFGTSAAAPTAASIAALVLQTKGGPGSVTPAQMRTILQRSAFAHDLDPYAAKAQVVAVPNRGKVSVTLEGDNSVAARIDPNAFTVAYTGTSSIVSIVFDGTGGNPGGGNIVVPSTPGLVFDARPATGQPFVVGPASVGLGSGDVSATLLGQAPAPSVTGQYFGLRLDFAPGSFTGGKALRFGIGRATYRSAFVPPAGDSRAANSGDLAGSVTLQPEGSLAAGGIGFTGTLADGSTFRGVLANRIGSGWSFLDGYGFVNAQSAVAQPIP